VLATVLSAFVLASITTPVLWVIGVVVLVAGILTLLRGGIVGGIVLIIIGILLGALNVL
jgi:hypothetical protein